MTHTNPILRSLVLLAVTAAGALLAAPRLRAQQQPTASMAWAVSTHRASTWFAAPPEYRGWWDDLVAACECKPAVSFDLVAFQRLPGNTFACDDRHRCYGAFVQGYNVLFIAAAHLRDRLVVEHEMLHAILGRADHPPIFRSLGLADLD
jgi:hypothetical protein